MTGLFPDADPPRSRKPPGRIWRGADPPPGPMHVCFSGGRTSAFMLFRLIGHFGGRLPPDCRVVFANTGLEFPETLDFVRDVGGHWDVAIDWVEFSADAPRFRVVDHATASRNGEPFAQLIRKKRRLPSPTMRFCTEELKVQAATRFLKSLGWETWTQTLGIRADEAGRVRPPKWGRWTNWFPLVEGGVDRFAVADFWAGQNFDLKAPNRGGKNWKGNCDGCFLKPESSIARLIRDHPERAKWWEDREAEISKVRGRESTFSNRGASRRELREFVERQPDWIWQLDDGEGLFCQADGGECMGG